MASDWFNFSLEEDGIIALEGLVEWHQGFISCYVEILIEDQVGNAQFQRLRALLATLFHITMIAKFNF